MIKKNLLENIFKKDCQFRTNCYILIHIKDYCYNTELLQDKEDGRWTATNAMEMAKMTARIVREKVIHTKGITVSHAKDMVV